MRNNRHGHRTASAAAAAFAALLLFPSLAQAQERYFYRKVEYGSEALFNPVAMVINGSLGILQYTNLSRDLRDINFAAGLRNVTYNLSHPIQAVETYGWHEFAANELYPGDVNKKNAQYWPNYQNHLIGGGMDYIHTAEWYDEHRFSSPHLWALGTMVIYHFTNEIVENSSWAGPNVDPIADLYVFDPLGIILFSIDGVPRVFARTLNMAAWPGQPAVGLNAGTIENHGENYSIKWQLPFSEEVSLFYYWGLTGLLGASVHAGGGKNISFGAGLRAKELVAEGDQADGRKLTAELTWNAGVFYDRDNSLMASVLFSGISDYAVHVNLYPGMLEVFGYSGGFFCAVGEEGRFVAGLTLAVVPVGGAVRF